MNTPIQETELDPAERKRRAALRRQAERVARRLHLQPVPAKPGWWWHEGIGVGIWFPLSVAGTEMETIDDVLETIYWHGHKSGRAEVQAETRKAIGL